MSNFPSNSPVSAPQPPASSGGATPAAYRGLSTDFYPWPEVISDIKADAARGRSFLFSAWEPAAWANFIWREGALLGGYTEGRELPFGAVMRAMPRAAVSLLPLTAKQATQTWALRLPATQQKFQQSSEQWRASAAEAPQLVAGRSGVLCGPNGRWVSYWEAGSPVAGDWHPAIPGREWHFMAAPPPISREGLIDLWRQVLYLTDRQRPLDEVWKQASLRLAERHPALDPFTKEITLRGGELQVEGGVPVEELGAALLDAYRYSLRALNLPISALPLHELSGRPLWQESGLAALAAQAQPASAAKEERK